MGSCKRLFDSEGRGDGCRLGAAVIASLLLHGLLLAGVDAKPRARRGGAPMVQLTATLMPAPPAVALAPPPRVSDVPSVPAKPSDATEAAPVSGAAVATGGLLPLSYYPAKALDVLPRAEAVVRPDPPPDRDPLSGGKLRLKLWIEVSGTVSLVQVVDDGGLPEIFVDSARQAFLRSRFVPGQVGGRAVPSVVSLVVDYERVDPNDVP